MTYKITPPEHINVEIDLPSSKSISNRALIINALSGGDVQLTNLSSCDDTAAIVNALTYNQRVIDVGAGGTAMRFLTAYFSITPGEHVLTGTERMKQRPIAPLVEALRYLGADITYVDKEGFPPLLIDGKELHGGHVDVESTISSQFISALLLIGPVLRDGLELKLVGSEVSRSYIDLTLCTMREFGADVEWTDVNVITVKPVHYEPRQYKIEKDWSASSYWYEALALIDDEQSKVVMPGLRDASRQGDSMVRYIFSLLGIKTQIMPKKYGRDSSVTITRHMRTLPRFDYDFINSPDLAQTVVACSAALNLPFHFRGLNNLRVKETDRIEALKNELKKLGYVLYVKNDNELVWDGEKCGPTMDIIDTYKDHRMAMAFAPLAVKFPGIRINDPDVVTKSYPTFWEDMKKAGFKITEE
jgi:3-phosphoshikimate 1-carboxyvinyltransferase